MIHSAAPFVTMPAAGDAENHSQTVVVGVKMDSQSKELLTWSLVKVACPGDRVIALHVMASNDIVDPEGRSSLLSVVRAFDSVLAVYEGFCNLKQVDLKLKICRGSSVRKILVREAQSYSANKLVLGTASKHHTIRSSSTVAKYCAKKLSKDCSVLAIHNGKVVFQREAPPSMVKTKSFQGTNERQRNTLLSMLNESASLGLNLSDGGYGKGETCGELQQELIKANLDCPNIALKQNCTVCAPGHSTLADCLAKEKVDKRGGEEDSMAVVPWKNPELTNRVKEMLDNSPGWPLLQKTLLSRRDSDPSLLRQSPVAQRRCLNSNTNPNVTQMSCDDDEDGYSDLDGENGAIIPLGDEILSNSHHQDAPNMPLELDGLLERYSSTCRLFKYQELQSATSNFAPENLIGKGGSSRVYYGRLPDGKELAVKILRHSEDALKEFVLEIEIITSLHHKNITSLFGFSFEDNNLLLVYDLLPRGNLEENLHSSKKNPLKFGWNQRYKVALGIAEALHYLHSQSSPPVIHRDVKSSNILLSDDFEPQLSDFGLAKWASNSSQMAFSDVAGTFGYLAPEYFMFGKVTDKIDVYAYGVVLLELLSGRKPISNDQPKGQESLVLWAKPMLNGGNVSQLLDPSLGSNYNLDRMERMVLAANLCIRRSPRARPKMSLVLKLIQGDTDTIKWARLQVNTTDNTDRRHGECHPRPSSIQSHLNLALLDVEEDSVSMSSVEQNVSLEDYLRGRWSRSSSFD